MRDKIIKAASDIFTIKGVDKASLAEIALKANISKGTLYYHFSTKNDLVFAVTEMHMTELTNNLIDLLKSNDSPENIMVQLYSTIPKAVTRSRLHIYLVREAVTDSPKLLERFKITYASWKKNLIENISKLYPDCGDKEALAGFVIASIDGLVIQNLLEIDDIEPKRYVDLIKPILINN
jgi:AcrR family transcriptional regulator